MAFDAYSAPAPIEHPAVARQRLRRKLEAAVDRLILALDLMVEVDARPARGA